MADDQLRRDRIAAETAIFQREDDTLLETLCALYSLYSLRRATEVEKKFWNHFWYSWERKNHINAMRQAFADMANDPYFPSVSYDIDPNVFTFCNFERFVTYDVKKYINFVEGALNSHYVDMTRIFGRLDSYVQPMGVDYPLEAHDIVCLQSGELDHAAIRIALTHKFLNQTVASAVRGKLPPCSGDLSDGVEAMDGSKKDACCADNAVQTVEAVEITPEELERRKRNAENLRITVMERAREREKREAEQKARRLKKEERERKKRELHEFRMRTDSKYRIEQLALEAQREAQRQEEQRKTEELRLQIKAAFDRYYEAMRVLEEEKRIRREEESRRLEAERIRREEESRRMKTMNNQSINNTRANDSEKINNQRLRQNIFVRGLKKLFGKAFS